MAKGGTIACLLPATSFYLGADYAPARKFIEAGVPVALATDYNPGSSPSGDMRFIMALGCIRMRLTPVQALNACTLNGAYAMGVAGECGSVTPGKWANLLVCRPGFTLTTLPYLHQTPFLKNHPEKKMPASPEAGIPSKRLID